jgi:hypothetical protein
VAVQGHTTGSHLGLPDEDVMALSVIWLVTGGVATDEIAAGRRPDRPEHAR